MNSCILKGYVFSLISLITVSFLSKCKLLKDHVFSPISLIIVSFLYKYNLTLCFKFKFPFINLQKNNW